MNIRSLVRTVALASVALAASRSANGQTAENVAVIINEASPASIRVGEHYVARRGVPAANVIRIRTSTADEITREAFGASIESPIGEAIRKHSLHDRVLYLVLTKGIPLRVTGSSGLEGTSASVDSELTLLYRKMSGLAVPIRGPVENPYHLGTRPIAEAQRFTHRAHDIFLVSRLDAFTADDAIALIDRAQSPVQSGQVVLDQRATPGQVGGDRWLEEAAVRLRDAGLGDRVVLETTRNAARGVTPVLGYYSWGSNDPSNRVRRVEMSFVPGAIAATFVDTDARTFTAPPESWMPSAEWGVDRTYAGSSQSLTGDLIREGVTGVSGHVAEPFLQSAVRPEILFPAYLSGFNLIEAYYLAIPHLSWQTVVIGDPLCSPFSRKVLTSAEIEDPVDSATELPGLFGQRRVNVVRPTMKDVPARVLAIAVAAETRIARGDKAGAQRALEEVTRLAPSLPGPQLQLALLLEESGEYARATERYRVVLKIQPDNPLALNNLAYSLAVRDKAPAEARPLAQRAVELTRGNPAMVDTLAWIEYLLGKHIDAASLIGTAVKGAPDAAEIRLHAAFIYAALKDLQNAKSELSAALKIAPVLADREEVKELQARIGKGR
jgi:uncharacterized protein (TIGR03790 family)